MVHFAVLCEASPCSCHLYTKWERHKRKVVGWHDDSAESKSKELLGPIMSVWSDVHVSTHPHTHALTHRSDMHTGNIPCRSTSHKKVSKRSVSPKITLFLNSSILHSPTIYLT